MTKIKDLKVGALFVFDAPNYNKEVYLVNQEGGFTAAGGTYQFSLAKYMEEEVTIMKEHDKSTFSQIPIGTRFKFHMGTAHIYVKTDDSECVEVNCLHKNDDSGHLSVANHSFGPDSMVWIQKGEDDMTKTKSIDALYAEVEKNSGAIIKNLTNLTEKWGKKTYAKAKPLSARAKRLQEQLKTLHDEYGQVISSSFAMLASELTGEEIKVEKSMVSFVPGIIVVPLKNNNGHIYPLNVPCLRYDDDIFVAMKTGMSGNHLIKEKNGLRIATKEEIAKFVAAMIKLKSPDFLKALDYIDIKPEEE